jgi:hypothetical protein
MSVDGISLAEDGLQWEVCAGMVHSVTLDCMEGGNVWAVGRLVPDTVCNVRDGDRTVATQQRSKYTLSLRVVSLR